MEFKDHVADYGPLSAMLKSTLSSPEPSETEKERYSITMDLLADVSREWPDYDEYSYLTKEALGGKFSNIFTPPKFQKLTKSDLHLIFIFLSRAARERQLRKMPVATGGAVNRVLTFYTTNRKKLPADDAMEAEFFETGLLMLLVREAVGKVASKDGMISTTLQNWDIRAKQIEDRIAGSEALVRKFQQQFNFVGLAQAFENMAKRKRNEKWLLFGGLLILGTLVATPVSIQYWYPKDSIFTISGGSIATINFGKLVPLVLLELICLYFFRIVLHTYYSVKAQLLQLDLRFALCAFIESYTDFAREKGKTIEGQSTLARFEALIFSSIVPDADKVPSTFDGLDQLAKLIAESKSKK